MKIRLDDSQIAKVIKEIKSVFPNNEIIVKQNCIKVILLDDGTSVKYSFHLKQKI